jgi:regulator of protease activity HflC (stomatin/prohibitin superfamily)
VVRREPTARVLSVTVGHEGAEPENAPPENVLWARQHESNEFMFLLGDGRDLVTIDGMMRYRIRDLRAYLTSTADEPALLRGIVYAAVTHRTVDRSLDQVLSQNLAGFTHDIAAAVQADADALGIGVEIIDMTVGGMHPPVVVAAEYEAVVSAQVRRDTIAGAHGDAEEFRGARASLAAEPELFQYRRRLEALESGLTGRRISSHAPPGRPGSKPVASRI